MRKELKPTMIARPATVYATEVDIDMKRCLCIHSVSQLVDITLQSLLYQRQIIPEPVATLAKGDSHTAEQFRSVYDKVAHILQGTFRTANIERIAEFVILIGGTPYSPKEIYRIPVPVCRQEEREKDEAVVVGQQQQQRPEIKRQASCGTDCEELSAKEKRLIFSAVALSKTAVGHFENCPIPGKTDKVFMFIRTRGPLNTWTEGLAEDESFELPEEEVQRRRKIRQLRVQVHSGCGNNHKEDHHHHQNANGHSNNNNENTDNETDGEEADENAFSLWYRLAPFFTNMH